MTRKDRELLAELASLNKHLVTVAWAVMEGNLSPAEQHAVACRLVDLAEAIEARAKREDAGVVEGEVVTQRPRTGRSPRSCEQCA